MAYNKKLEFESIVNPSKEEILADYLYKQSAQMGPQRPVPIAPPVAPPVTPQPGFGQRFLSGITEYAKSPEGMQSLMDLAGLVAAGTQKDPYVKRSIAKQVGETIAQRPILEQQRLEREQAEEDRKRQIEKDKQSEILNKLNIESKNLQNLLNTGLLEGKLTRQDLELKKLELDLEKELSVSSEQDLMKKEAYKKAYGAWLTKVTDPSDARFRARMQDSNKILTDMEEAKTWSIYTKSPNPFKIKQRKQAEINFLTAVLRDESGASIGTDEYVTARKVYFPEIGDSKEIVKQKQQARQRAFQLIEPKMIESESIQENATYIGEI